MDRDIAPLAQRLAEENNVDWRSLEGSGENGRIVERDVLEYLARVMAGEEATDPTPEPLPEGMEAWLDDEGRPIDAPGAASEGAAPPDEAVELAGDDADTSGGTDEDLLLAGDDLLVGEDAAAPATHDEVPEPIDAPEPTEPAAAPAASEADGAPDLFVDDHDARRAGDEVPDLFEADGDVDDDGGREPAFDFGGLPGATAPTPPGVAPDAMEAGEDATEAFTFDEPAAAPVEPAADEAEAWSDAAPSAMPDRPGHDEPEAVPAPPPPAATPVATTRASGAGEEAWPLARVRTVVRRHVELGGLLASQRAAALEAGRDQVSAAAVLLVAVRRAAERLELDAPGVVLPGRDGGVTTVVPAAHGIAEIAAELDAAARGEPAADRAADLWIADLSGLGVDEAILDGDVPQLTLGRVLSDEEDGALHGTLTFAGEHDLAHAAAFLARVADLLEEPLRLLA
jgi:hypothetical protein